MLCFLASAYNPADWKGGQVWLGGTLWPSVDALLAAWNSTKAGGSRNSSSLAGVNPAAVERLKAFNFPAPSESNC